MEAAVLAPSLKSIAPQQEYLLQGSILDAHRDVLLHRLRGLCDNAENSPESFNDYEAVYMLRNSSTTQQSQFVLFRVRHALDRPDAPAHIRYLGQAEVGDRGRHTLVRACLDVACSPNVRDFLMEMGFRLDHDYVAQGFFFHKGRMKVTVYKIFKLQQPGKTDQSNLEPLGSSHLVELSVVAPLGQEQIGDDMKNFAEQLKPLVSLEKVDHRRIQ
ncbi:mediator of RNA polymerase II transcription subunit 18 [Aplysia californica]|uniref:Mediator of RNA polymerase II transcription subunit 18 n=1 Tax=Aplysia californica TaxID=6500 RepID=A0ABM0JDB0_APLCA|nr:mediator of RNA polymerase II transcription subunit 18 [Aplysia californica]XP_012944483.1 mediator of RNA polymerase II transcription subunit 18 [Aplysia californica]XP_012944488.1 mediator of RNA polymerase II transcription subunit 18 [Aplysia californica]